MDESIHALAASDDVFLWMLYAPRHSEGKMIMMMIRETGFHKAGLAICLHKFPISGETSVFKLR